MLYNCIQIISNMSYQAIVTLPRMYFANSHPTGNPASGGHMAETLLRYIAKVNSMALAFKKQRYEIEGQVPDSPS